MWKPRKEEEQGSTISASTPSGYSVSERSVSASTPRMPPVEQARIGKGLQVKGEIAGAEDLYIDGDVQGSIALREQSLTVGPEGRVRANITAGQVIISGKVNGNITGKRVELKSSANVVGDISTERIVIEDGAYLKGGVDVHKHGTTSETRAESMAAAATAAGPVVEPEYAHAGLEEKKV